MDDLANQQKANPTGKPDKRPLSDWLLLALIRPGDIEAAHQLYVDSAPRAYRGLLSEEGFAFDPIKRRYVHTDTGRPVPPSDIKRLSILLAAAIAFDMQRNAQLMAEGKIPVDEWQREAASLVKDQYIVQAAIGAGGFAGLTESVREKVTGNAEEGIGLAYAIGRLSNFADDVAERRGNNTSVPYLRARAALYSDASVPVMELVRRDIAASARDERGRPVVLFERNILTPGENCSESTGAPGCVETTDLGWQPLGTLPAIGTRTCKFNCKCTWEFSLTPPGTKMIVPPPAYDRSLQVR